ncbi:MAG: Crp/Fnr family transcriptional regulator [Ignavibacteriaceae bacterium]
MAEKTKLWYLENFNLFKGLNDDKKAELKRITSMRELNKNEPIYFANDPSTSIFFLKTGRVKIVKYSSDGKENILTLINPGEIFGEMAFLDEKERTDFAITVEPALICAINKDDLGEFINKTPSLNIKMTKLIGLKLKSFSERIEDLVFKDADQRVISFLLRMIDKNGKSIGKQIFVKPFLKHQDIAELAACSRQTVNYILTDLRDKNIINFDRKKLIINDLPALKNYLN